MESSYYGSDEETDDESVIFISDDIGNDDHDDHDPTGSHSDSDWLELRLVSTSGYNQSQICRSPYCREPRRHLYAECLYDIFDEKIDD